MPQLTLGYLTAVARAAPGCSYKVLSQLRELCKVGCSSLIPKERTRASFSGLKNSLSSAVETGKKEGVEEGGRKEEGKAEAWAPYSCRSQVES